MHPILQTLSVNSTNRWSAPNSMETKLDPTGSQIKMQTLQCEDPSTWVGNSTIRKQHKLENTTDYIDHVFFREKRITVIGMQWQYDMEGSIIPSVVMDCKIEWPKSLIQGLRTIWAVRSVDHTADGRFLWKDPLFIWLQLARWRSLAKQPNGPSSDPLRVGLIKNSAT